MNETWRFSLWITGGFVAISGAFFGNTPAVIGGLALMVLMTMLKVMS